MPLLGERLGDAREGVFQIGHGRGEGEPDIAFAAEGGAGDIDGGALAGWVHRVVVARNGGRANLVFLEAENIPGGLSILSGFAH